MSSCAVRQAPCELPRGTNLLVGFDEASFNSRGNYLRGYSRLALLKVEALAQRLVGHPLRHLPPQGAVLVGSADSVNADVAHSAVSELLAGANHGVMPPSLHARPRPCPPGRP